MLTYSVEKHGNQATVEENLKKVNLKRLTRITSEKRKTLERVGALACVKKYAYCVQASNFVSSFSTTSYKSEVLHAS